MTINQTSPAKMEEYFSILTDAQIESAYKEYLKFKDSGTLDPDFQPILHDCAELFCDRPEKRFVAMPMALLSEIAERWIAISND